MIGGWHDFKAERLGCLLQMFHYAFLVFLSRNDFLGVAESVYDELRNEHLSELKVVKY